MKLQKDNYDFVLVVGNGFDLNLGLETGYVHFLNSEDFKSLINSSNKLARYLADQFALQNWIDVENEIRNYAEKIQQKMEDFHSDFKELSSALKNFLSSLDYEIINKNSLAYNLIGKFKEGNLLIIDFNYTSTIRIILNELKAKGELKSEVEHIKIHGSIEENDIIFGIEDGARIPSKYVFLKKSSNKNFYAVDFGSAIQKCKDFVLFGHSLGETDHMYFQDFFQNSCNKLKKDDNQNSIFFHYGEMEYYKLLAQIDTLTFKNITKLKLKNNVYFTDAVKAQQKIDQKIESQKA
jgi:hypothetical protein